MSPKPKDIGELERVWEEIHFLGEPEDPINVEKWDELFAEALQATTRLITTHDAQHRQRLLEAVGEDEDINAPVNVLIGAESESLVRHDRLTRRILRGELREAINKEYEGSDEEE